MILNCIAVDDEPPALDLICRFVGQTPFFKLTESFDNAIEALSFIGKNPVDLIFLDIQMPDALQTCYRITERKQCLTF